MIRLEKTFRLSLRYAGFLFILLAFSCKNSEEKNSIDILTLRGPSAISMLYLMEGFKEMDDIPLHYEILNEPLQIRARMLREEPELAIMPTNMAANLYNKGVSYQLAAISVWGTLSVFGNDTSIKNWKDLKGKRIHLMAKGMTPDILFRYLAEKNNLDPDKDMILDYSFPSHSDLANAVIAGLADIAVLSEPLISMVKKENRKINTIFNLEQEWKEVLNKEFSIPQTSLVVKESFARDNPEAVIQFIEEYRNNCSRVVANPADAARLTVKYDILPDIEVAEQAIPGCNLKVMPSWEVKGMVKAYLDVFYNFDPESIGGQLPDETFYLKK